MKIKLILPLLLIIFVPAVLFAEGFIGGGGELTVSPNAETVVVPAVGAVGGLDLFAPLGTYWSMFCDGGGSFSLYPRSLDFGGKAYLQGDISYRGDVFYARLTPEVYFEHWTTRDFPLWKQHAELYLSLDYSRISLFAAPAFSWTVEDLRHTFGMDGSIGISAGLGKILLSPAVSGGFYFLPDGGMELFISPSLELTYYPAAPLTVTAAAGMRRTSSDYREIVVEGAGPLPADSGTSVFWEPSVSAFLGKRFDLELSAPGSVTVFDYGFIADDGTVGADQEYRLYINPKAVLTFAAADRLDLEFVLAGEVLHSNSNYLSSGNISAGVSAFVMF
jgi:hypothetical protein